LLDLRHTRVPRVQPRCSLRFATHASAAALSTIANTVE
jgi:hypothetical protein